MISLNEERLGNFTSSEIWRLMTNDRSGKNPGEQFYSYIEEKNMERELGISLGSESDARPLQWGKHCEIFAFNKIGINYTITSDVTTVHPEHDMWVGSADGYSADAVFDLKCPMTRKSFFKLVAGENIFAMRDGFTRKGADYKKHSEGDKYFWQLVSNGAILRKLFAELIIYMPYISDLKDITAAAHEVYPWIFRGTSFELPCIVDGGAFKDVTTHRFLIPPDDIKRLTERVLMGAELLIKRPEPAVFTVHDQINGKDVTVVDQIK